MLRIRVAEESIAGLLVEDEIRCPTHLYTGQEAIAAGGVSALTGTIYIRCHPVARHYLAKGWGSSIPLWLNFSARFLVARVVEVARCI